VIQEENSNSMSIIAGNTSDPAAIAVQVSLPAAVWERLTADLRDDDRESLKRPELADTPLRCRIEMFLEMQLIAWEASVTEYPDHSGVSDDLDDGSPF